MKLRHGLERVGPEAIVNETELRLVKRTAVVWTVVDSE